MLTDKQKESRRKYMQSDKGKAAQNRSNAKYRQTDQGKLMTALSVGKYQQTDQGKATLRKGRYKRRIIIKDAGFHTLQEWSDLVARFNYTCLRCGCNTCKLTVDHIMPLSKGGSNTIDNLQPLCHSCNASKKDKYIDYR